MREATNNEYPRYAVWENVTGCYSSNGGEDFRSVLDAFVSVKEENAPPVPMPEKGKWPKAGCLLGDGWSIAYRTLDAQWWATPQRRARIYLVADFGGTSAPKVLFESESLSRYTPQSVFTWKRVTGCAEESFGASGGGVDHSGAQYCVNPQGCSGVSITEDQTGTLVAQDHGHHPAVLQSAGFSTEHSAKARSIGYEEEKSPTLRVSKVPAALSLQHNPTDSRLKIEEDGRVQTLTNRAATGGNNVPLVAIPDPITLKIRCGHGNGGRGALIQRDMSATLATSNDQTLFQPVGFDRYNGAVTGDVTQTLNADAGHSGQNEPMVFEPTEKQASRAFGICSKGSYAMQSDNQHTGFYEATTSRTLDQSCNNPTSAQGGIAILEEQPTYALQGSMIGRTDKNGPQGSGISKDVSFTLDVADRHGVVAPTYCATTGSYMEVTEEKSSTLMARDYKDPMVVNDQVRNTIDEPMYIVRRLTPTECARLQAFPDWWCMGLETPDPSEEEIAFWTEVWGTWRKATNPDGKPKTDNQIRKWLADPYSQSAEYSIWGNGIQLNCAFFVLAGIAWAYESELSDSYHQ